MFGWFVFRALITTAFIYECYCVGEEFVIIRNEEQFNVPQMVVYLTNAYTANEKMFFGIFAFITITIWFI